MKPLNAISVYEHGFIAPLYTSFSESKVKELEMFAIHESNHGRLSAQWATMSFMIKVPLFVLTKLVNYEVKILFCKEDNEQYYIPTEAEIVASDLETARLIKEDIASTTEALKVNPKAYMSDGCQPDAAHTITPISRYVVFLAEAKTRTWLSICDSMNQKTISKQFSLVLQSIISSEGKTS
jgi:hypothetical protein